MQNEIERLKATLKAVLADIDAHTAVMQATSSFPVSKEKLEAASQAIKKAEDLLQALRQSRNACECGCGGYPKTPGARFLPGHDLRKAYQDQKGPESQSK